MNLDHYQGVGSIGTIFKNNIIANMVVIRYRY